MFAYYDNCGCLCVVAFYFGFVVLLFVAVADLFTM